VEVEIIGLTEIVKKERYRSKTYGYPVAIKVGKGIGCEVATSRKAI